MTAYFILNIFTFSARSSFLGRHGIAFFMVMAHRSEDVSFIARTAATVVIADFLFTLSAVIVQPVTGVALMLLSLTSIREMWLAVSLCFTSLRDCSGFRRFYADRDARSCAARSSSEAAIFRRVYFHALSSMVPVWNSGLWLGHDHPVLMIAKPAM